jgi:hypothetical protein
MLPSTDLRPRFPLHFSDGDTVEIRVSTDGKTLQIRDNHAAGERVDPTSMRDRSQ